MEIHPGLYNRNPLYGIFPPRVRLAAERDIMEGIEQKVLKDSIDDAMSDAVKASVREASDAVKDSIRDGLENGSINSIYDLSQVMARDGVQITGDGFSMATVLGEDAGKVGPEAMAGGERGPGGEMKTPEEAKLENGGGEARQKRAQALEELNTKMDELTEEQRKLTQNLEDGLKDTCKDSKFCKWKGNSVMSAVKTFLKMAIPLAVVMFAIGAFEDDGGTCKFQGWPSNEDECNGAAKIYTNATGVWDAANKTCTISQGSAEGSSIINSDNCNHQFRRDVSQGTKFLAASGSKPNRCQVVQWPRDATACESVATTASATNTGTFDGSVEWANNCCTMKGGKMKKTDCQHYCQKPCDGPEGAECYSKPSFFDKLGRGLKCVFGVFGGDDCLTNSIMNPVKRLLLKALYVLLLCLLIWWILFWKMWPFNLLVMWAYHKTNYAKTRRKAQVQAQKDNLQAMRKFSAGTHRIQGEIKAARLRQKWYEAAGAGEDDALNNPATKKSLPNAEEFANTMSQFQNAFESSLSSM